MPRSCRSGLPRRSTARSWQATTSAVDDDQPATNWIDDLKGAGKSYKESWSESGDPLTKMFSDVGEAVSGAATKVWSKFGNNGGSQEPLAPS